MKREPTEPNGKDTPNTTPSVPKLAAPPPVIYRYVRPDTEPWPLVPPTDADSPAGAAKPCLDEPYALIGQVRICGRPGGQPPGPPGGHQTPNGSCSKHPRHARLEVRGRYRPRENPMTYADTLLPEFAQEMANTRKVLQRIP